MHQWRKVDKGWETKQKLELYWKLLESFFFQRKFVYRPSNKTIIASHTKPLYIIQNNIHQHTKLDIDTVHRFKGFLFTGTRRHSPWKSTQCFVYFWCGGPVFLHFYLLTNIFHGRHFDSTGNAQVEQIALSISYTCAFPAMTRQNVCREKGATYWSTEVGRLKKKQTRNFKKHYIMCLCWDNRTGCSDHRGINWKLRKKLMSKLQLASHKKF